MTENQFPIGQRVTLPGHFRGPVTLEAVRPIGSGYECRVWLSDGSPDETILSREEAEALIGQRLAVPPTVRPVDPEKIRLLVESARIRLAYAHDRHFAVSLSGIRTLPHQVEAVYMKMLPQPRLRFLLLADDPGAGKTIMAGLLLKELKLREAIERILILCPAPLTIQWQDELLRWFGEPFDIIFSAVDQQQLVNPWKRQTQVISSLDYAKREDVRERMWGERWDFIVIDEAHKCSAYTKHSNTRGFGERGQDEKLGLPGGDGQPAPIIDALQRTLWLMENRPAQLAEFLREAQPNREQMRLVAQALAGPALKGGELPDVSPSGELAALTKLLANWKSVVEDAALSAQEREDQRTGQRKLL